MGKENLEVKEEMVAMKDNMTSIIKKDDLINNKETSQLILDA